MERDPFTDTRGLGPIGKEAVREGNWREIARQQDEIRSKRAALDQRISQLSGERYELEDRAARQWGQLSRKARHVASEQHRVVGNELRGVLHTKEALRERETRLDEVASAAREAERATDRVRDREAWKTAGIGLEGRLAEREQHTAQRERLNRSAKERRSTLPDRGELSRQARQTFPPSKETDREIEL